MGSPVIWNGRTGKNLSPDGMKAKNGRQEFYLEVDPRTTATEGNQGDFLSSIYGKFQKLDSGTTTNWKRIDVEVSPYKLYDSFEMETVASLPANWTKYGNTNTALNYPDNFGGSASASSYTTVANTGLSGANLFRASVSSSDNGKGVYRAFSISNGEKGLPFIFESQINLTKTGSLEWASNAQIWIVGSSDNFVSNFQNIPLTNYVVSKSGLLKGSFIDSSATLTSFRLCIHFSGLTDAFNVDFDEVKIYQSNADTLSPNSKKVISSWGYKSGTTLGTGSTNTKIVYIQSPNIVEQNGSIYDYFTYTQSTVNGDSWVAKSSFKLRVDFCIDEASGSDSIGVSINSTELTTDYAIINDNNKLTAISLSDVSLATGARLINKGDTLRIHRQSLSLNSNGYFKLIFDIDENTGSNVIASGENFMPIKAVSNANQSAPSGTAVEVNFGNNGSDSRFITSARFKLPPNGRFVVFFKGYHTASGGYVRAEIRKNGVYSPQSPQYTDSPETGSNNYPVFTFPLDTSGNSESDYYSVWFTQGTGSTQTLISGYLALNIDRLDKPFSMNLFQAAGMVLSPTDNVLPAQFSRSTTQSIPSGANTAVVWDTTNYNPSGAIQINTSTGRVTNNGVSGYYKFSGLIRTPSYSGSSNTYCQIYRTLNGGTPLEVALVSGVTANSGYTGVPYEFTVYLTQGSYIDVVAYHNFGSSLSFNITTLDVQRVDKTAVSAGGGYTKWQTKNLSADTTATGTVSSLSFNNLEIGKTYRATLSTHPTQSTGTVSRYSFINGTKIGELSFYAAGAHAKSIVFVSISTTLTIDASSNDYGLSAKTSTDERTCLILEELPQHIQTNQWT